LEDITKLKAKHPDHKLLVHPECDPTIVEQADEVLSTGGMMKYLESGDKVIIATENG
jgi:quinolinate synthase